MKQTTQSRRTGAYTANLLGNIRSHLAGLQGYDVMALELIQNADDAKAEKIGFDITDQGLLVRNSGRFTYCGDLSTRPCRFIATHDRSCDYHSIADVGSGGKLSDGENIGRFGIGFVSTYQVTDHPEIRSSGIKLTLRPEEGQWFVEPFNEPGGTSFFLPWADDPDTEARRALGVSHVSAAHIEQLAEDFQAVLRKSLLFLRHIQKAELRRNGALLLACDLDRGEGSDLIVSFRPSDEAEHWHILRADAAAAASLVYAKHPRLEALHRSTTVSIGLRIEPEPITDGLLYAYLPTEQSTGLPLHLNADFFPESDRKAVIFAGHQHEQAWNEMLIDAAAAELGRDPENLLNMLGHVQLWRVLGRAYDISSKPTGHPPCFKGFWERLKASGGDARIALAQDSSVQRPRGVFLPRAALTTPQAKSLLEIGGRLATEDLRPYYTAMGQLGAPILTLERLVGLLETAMAQQVAGEIRVAEERLEHFYRPLWGIVNDLLPDAATPNPAASPILQRLMGIPLIVSEDLFAVTITQTYAVPPSLDGLRITALLPRLAVASHHILEFPKIARLITSLGLGAVVKHISEMCVAESIEDVIAVAPKDLRDLYTLFADLDQQSKAENSVYEMLRGLPIWLSSRGLIRATQALLPGDFTDPTGHADLLDTAVLTENATDFVSSKLGVRTQTIEAFVQTVLPHFFNESGPLDDTKYPRLIAELSSHPTLVNDDNIRRLLASLPIVPTLDGRWSRPTYTYRRTEDLVKVLGEAPHLWLDSGRLPNARSVQNFIDSLGIRRSPIARHLVDRMLHLAEKFLPSEDVRRASSEAFYVLCDNYEQWTDKAFFESAIADLRGAACFPSDGDMDNWYAPESLYAPYRAEAFRSQARILDFKNTARLNTELLQELDVSITPETSLVVAHLQHCVSNAVPPHVSTYQVLNERAQRDDPLIATLAEASCIYVESQKAFVRPNQLYWSPQQLGRFAFTIPSNLESFKPLFTAIGVKSAPAGRDFADILLDIVGEYFEKSKPVLGPDRSVYDMCMSELCAADSEDVLLPAEMHRLREAPSILNIKGQPTHPDEVLLQDSQWHAGFFGGELDPALCKPESALWNFVEKLGVRKLSESAHVALDFVDGPPADEASLADKLMDRKSILARLLHDKPAAIRSKIQKALANLTAVSYDLVHIRATVNIGAEPVSAAPVPTQAFYDSEKGRLILARPLGPRLWSHTLNALFHQLMPGDSGSEISKLTLSVRPLMGMSVEEAHLELTDAGIPYQEHVESSGDVANLTSRDIDNIGGDSSSTEEETIRSTGEADGLAPEATSAGATKGEGTSRPAVRPAQHSQGSPSKQPTDATGPGETLRTRTSSQIDTPMVRGEGRGAAPGESGAKKPRAKHKEQWDRRLLSYVRKKTNSEVEGEADGATSEHNLGIEVVARAAVCRYEKARGRLPEQMPQTHPGYDIISRDPITGEERYIEVKGVNGEWNKIGVGLSRLQFSNAQDFGERFWLYVVEFVGNPDHMRVHPIQSPATQVTSFMFDGNWRDAVSDELADPALPFIVGAKVRHKSWGIGQILTVDLRGSTRVMSIEFETSGRRTVTLNLNMMEVVEDNNDGNPS